MRIPKRKSEDDRRALEQTDHFMTQEAIDRMKRTIVRLKHERPLLVAEVTRTQAMGDLSENAGYQDAKYRLRRTDSRILSLEERIKHAVPIQVGSTNGAVSIGSTVTLEQQGHDQTFTVLGSHESDPSHGRISYSSPLGALLIGKQSGEQVSLNGNIFTIVRVE